MTLPGPQLQCFGRWCDSSGPSNALGGDLAKKGLKCYGKRAWGEIRPTSAEKTVPWPRAGAVGVVRDRFDLRLAKKPKVLGQAPVFVFSCHVAVQNHPSLP